MPTVDNNPIAHGSKRRPDIALKRAENKEKLVDEIINMIQDNMYEYEKFCLDLVREALLKRTQKELKEFLC